MRPMTKRFLNLMPLSMSWLLLILGGPYVVVGQLLRRQWFVAIVVVILELVLIWGFARFLRWSPDTESSVDSAESTPPRG
jgi:hypothetical protein